MEGGLGYVIYRSPVLEHYQDMHLNKFSRTMKNLSQDMKNLN
jgi:hypothetical protein